MKKNAKCPTVMSQDLFQQERKATKRWENRYIKIFFYLPMFFWDPGSKIRDGKKSGSGINTRIRNTGKMKKEERWGWNEIKRWKQRQIWRVRGNTGGLRESVRWASFFFFWGGGAGEGGMVPAPQPWKKPFKFSVKFCFCTNNINLNIRKLIPSFRKRE